MRRGSRDSGGANASRGCPSDLPASLVAMDSKLIDDCFAHDKKRLRHDEALAILKQRVAPVAGMETVPLAEAAGRILAAAGRRAASGAGAHQCRRRRLFLCRRRLRRGRRRGAAGGRPRGGGASAGAHAGPGTAARIFTGAVMPEGHDTSSCRRTSRPGPSTAATVVAIPAGPQARGQRQEGRRGREGRRGLARGGRGAAPAGPGRAGLASAWPRCDASRASGWASSRRATRWCGRAAPLAAGPGLRCQRADARRADRQCRRHAGRPRRASRTTSSR